MGVRIVVVTSEITNPIEEHIENVEAQLDELKEEALETVVGEENARRIEKVFEAIETTDQELEDAVRKYFPEVRNPFGDFSNFF